MKTTLLFLLVSISAFSQPVISGDTMLCPDENGTTTVEGSTVYDSYEWQWKYWFTSDPFQTIPGADGPSFTYDWYTYDQALLKVIVTLNGQTFESNTIQIDSYAWVGLTMGHEMGEHVTFDPNTEGFVLCEGYSFLSEIFAPYTTNIQWFKDGVAIDGANNMQYQISSAGTYYVSAAPEFCPNSISTSMPITVSMDSDCSLSINGPSAEIAVKLYPNPVGEYLNISSERNIKSVALYSLTGQLLKQQTFADEEIYTGNLASGIYILDLLSEYGSKKIKFVKK